MSGLKGANKQKSRTNFNNNNVRTNSKPEVPSKPDFLKVSNKQAPVQPIADCVTPRGWQPPRKFSFTSNVPESMPENTSIHKESQTKFTALPAVWRPAPKVLHKGKSLNKQRDVKTDEGNGDHPVLMTNLKSLCLDDDEPTKGFGSLKRMWNQKSRNVNDSSIDHSRDAGFAVHDMTKALTPNSNAQSEEYNVCSLPTNTSSHSPVPSTTPELTRSISSSSSNSSVKTSSFKSRSATWHFVTATSPTKEEDYDINTAPPLQRRQTDLSLHSPLPFRSTSIDDEFSHVNFPVSQSSHSSRSSCNMSACEEANNIVAEENSSDNGVLITAIARTDDDHKDKATVNKMKQIHHNHCTSRSSSQEIIHQSKSDQMLEAQIYDQSSGDVGQSNGHKNAVLHRMDAVSIEGSVMHEAILETSDEKISSADKRSEEKDEMPPPLLPREKILRTSRSSLVPPPATYGIQEWRRTGASRSTFRHQFSDLDHSSTNQYQHGEVSPDSAVPPPLLSRDMHLPSDYTPMAGSDSISFDRKSLGSTNSLNSPPIVPDTAYEPMGPYDSESKEISYSTAINPPLTREASVREYHEIDPDPDVGMVSPSILDPEAVPPPPNSVPPSLPSGAKAQGRSVQPPPSPPPLPPMNMSERKPGKKLNYIEVVVGAGAGDHKAKRKSQNVKTNYTEVIVGSYQKENGDTKKGKSVKGKILSMFATKTHDGYSSDGDVLSESSSKHPNYSEEHTTDFAKERNKLKRLSGRLLRKKKTKSRAEINVNRSSADIDSTFPSGNPSASVGIYGSATNLSTTPSESSRSLSQITSSSSAASSGEGQAGSSEKRHQQAYEDANNQISTETVEANNHGAVTRRQSHEVSHTQLPPRLSQKSNSEMQLNTPNVEMNLSKSQLRPQEISHTHSRSAESTPNHQYKAQRTGAISGNNSPIISAPRVSSHLHQTRPVSEPLGIDPHERPTGLLRPVSSPLDMSLASRNPGIVKVFPSSLPLDETPPSVRRHQQELPSPNFPPESPPLPPSSESPPAERPMRFSQKAIRKSLTTTASDPNKPPEPMRGLKPDRFKKRGRGPSDETNSIYSHAMDVPEIKLDGNEAKQQEENSGDPIYDVVPYDMDHEKPITPLSAASKSKFLESEPLYQVYRSRTLSHASTRRHRENQRRRVKSTVVETKKSSDSIWQSELMTDDAGSTTLWKEVPEVVNSGVGKDLTNDQMKLQQAQFEVVTSQASYMRSLNILINHFMRDWALESTDILPRVKRKQLFSNIEAVQEVEQRFLQDIEQHFWSKLYLTDVAKITAQYARSEFDVYVRYIQNQVYQDRVLTDLQRNNEKFSVELCRLESSPFCNKLPLLSFLLLPMQRVTRLPLLVSAIVNQADSAGDKEAYTSAKQALAVVNKLVKKCNEGARKMQQTEQLAEIASELSFASKVKTYALVSQSRALVKKGEMQVTMMQENKKSKMMKLYLFLFTDVLLMAKKRGFEVGSNSKFEVIDWAKRAMLFVNERAVSESEIFLVLLENCHGKRVEMTLMPVSQNELSRWTDALNPQKAEESGDSIYESWDCPQYQCIVPYTAVQPDELTLDVYDVMRVLRKTTDGWLEGERMRDNEIGWFPTENCEEIQDEHVRARNLRNLYRIIPAGVM